MIIDTLRLAYEQNRGKQSLYLRNLLKEQLQYYILNFVYNSRYAETLLSKGGTCLRFCFGLPRLSEDLDFDVEESKKFNFHQFIDNLKNYFTSKLQYKDLEIRVSGVHKIIDLRFPVLKAIGAPVDEGKPTDNVLFVRIDLAAIAGESFKKELSLKSSFDFSFLIRHYSLADLYAGKIAAILTRETKEGEKRLARFKGRDFFDIWWLKEKNISWNSAYLSSIINISSESEIKKRINAKIQEAARRKRELKADLLPFMENPAFVEDFVNNLGHLRF